MLPRMMGMRVWVGEYSRETKKLWLKEFGDVKHVIFKIHKVTLARESTLGSCFESHQSLVVE